jgi:hypothetical protein
MKIIYICTDSYGFHFHSEGDLTPIAVPAHSDRGHVRTSRLLLRVLGRLLLRMLGVSTRGLGCHDLRANILHGVISSVLGNLNLMLTSSSQDVEVSIASLLKLVSSQ